MIMMVRNLFLFFRKLIKESTVSGTTFPLKSSAKRLKNLPNESPLTSTKTIQKTPSRSILKEKSKSPLKKSTLKKKKKRSWPESNPRCPHPHGVSGTINPPKRGGVGTV